MIRFACPSCQSVLTVPEEQSGTKLNCPQCRQRLKVPEVELNRTIVGQLLPADLGIPRTTGAAGPAPPAAVRGLSPTADGRAGTAPAAVPTRSSPAGGAQWYFARGGQRQGPVNFAQLQQMVSAGQVLPADLVWSGGMPAWTAASKVPGLLRAPPVAPPPPPAGAVAPASLAPPRPPDVLTVRPLSPGPAPNLLSPPPGPRPVAPARRTRRGPAWKGRLPLIAGGVGAGVLLLVLLIVLFVSLKRPSGKQEDEDRVLSPSELVERCGPSVALVKGSISSGTGFLTGGGLFVTNSHVIGDEVLGKVEMQFKQEGGARLSTSGTLLYEDRERDLAIFRVRVDRPSLKVADGYKLKAGEEVVVIGNPGATAAAHHVTLENAVTKGNMSTEVVLDGMNFYQISASINPGNSGGPVFDMRGRVVGVVTRKAVGSRQEGMGFAVPVAELLAALEKVEGADAGRVEVEHNAVTAFRRLARTGRVRVGVMAICLQSIREFQQRGQRAQDGFDVGRQRASERFGGDLRRSEVEMREVDELLPKLRNSGSLSTEVRGNIDKLANTTRQMQYFIDNPRSADFFDTKYKELEGAYKEQVEALKAHTGVKDLD